MSNEENLEAPEPKNPDAGEPTETPAAESVAASPAAQVSERQEVSIRRAPKFSVFLVLGIIFGIIVAAILTFAFPEVEGKTNWNQVFGFLFLPCTAIGAAIGAVVALILDRRSRSKKRMGRAVADHIEVHDDEEQ